MKKFMASVALLFVLAFAALTLSTPALAQVGYHAPEASAFSSVSPPFLASDVSLNHYDLISDHTIGLGSTKLAAKVHRAGKRPSAALAKLHLHGSGHFMKSHVKGRSSGG